MLFGEDEHDVNNADIKKMKKTHNEFVDTVKKSLRYYL
jgi:hypothetical protein